MKIKISCRCGCEFILTDRVCSVDSEIKCPNCGRALPPGSSPAIKECFASFNEAKMCLDRAELYEISIQPDR